MLGQLGETDAHRALMTKIRKVLAVSSLLQHPHPPQQQPAHCGASVGEQREGARGSNVTGIGDALIRGNKVGRLGNEAPGHSQSRCGGAHVGGQEDRRPGGVASGNSGAMSTDAGMKEEGRPGDGALNRTEASSGVAGGEASGRPGDDALNRSEASSGAGGGEASGRPGGGSLRLEDIMRLNSASAPSSGLALKLQIYFVSPYSVFYFLLYSTPMYLFI